MITFFEGIFDFIRSMLSLILSVFQAFWTLLTSVATGINWLTNAVVYLPDFAKAAVLAVLGIMVVYIIITKGESEN